ncbi:WxL domain-containing protein [Enterococcus faecalis]|uniref:WxL domain-containing protein n=1 Tax=Enterococcus faecalis TaxID=1351 RepID=UPI0005357A7B|nr:WxL domain-containing protein [Enterococcus faecalis]
MKYKSVLGLVTLSTLSLSTAVLAGDAAENNQYKSNSVVEFIPNSTPTPPVNPENPDPEKPTIPTDPTNPEGPNPGTQGPLAIDYASSLDFGKNRISNKDQVYFARAQAYEGDQEDTSNFVQVSDNRGTNSGWSLTVKQDGQLSATTNTQNKSLTGAQITFFNPNVSSNAQNVVKPVASERVVIIPDEEVVVTKAAKGTGAGTWATYWGSVESVEEQTENGELQNVNVTKAIQLSVPGSTPKDAVKYQTKLIWSLTDVPGI